MRNASSNSVAVKSVDERAVRRAMDAYAAGLLAAHGDVEEIVVFGSFAAGNWPPGSDLDVLVVLGTADRPIHERIPLFLPGPFPVPMDVFPFTRAELAERAGSPILAAAARSTWRYARAAGPLSAG